MLENNIWRSEKKGFEEAIAYIKGRSEGVIHSMKTPWNSFNNATVDGLEWHSLTVIAGRPASGKTAILQQLIREAYPLNVGQTIRVLCFNFEMPQRTMAIREFSSVTDNSYRELCSAGGFKINENIIDKILLYKDQRIKYPIDIVDEPMTIEQFKAVVYKYMEAHKKENGKYTNTLITVDHSILFKLDKGENDKTKMLYNLGEVLTHLKKRFPIAFVVLSQLNREAEDPIRNEDGKYGNYVLETDIFGGDALLQHTDTLIGIKRPLKYNIKFYGPEKFIITDKDLIAFHFLKARNGETGIAWFKGIFSSMKVIETEVPAKQMKRISTT
jgi:replicative DNA helicase